MTRKTQASKAKIDALIHECIGDDNSNDPWTREPLPQWFINVALRFGRIFMPKLTMEDFRNNKPRFLGYFAAFFEGVMLEAVTAPESARPKTEFADKIDTFAAELGKHEPEFLSAVFADAQDMPPEHRTEFLAAYADGLKRGVALLAMGSLKDSNTAKMCCFLMWARPWIDAKRVENGTKFFQDYCTIHAAFGRLAAPNPDALASLKVQFSSLCSECGVKFRERGRPKSK